MLHGCAEALLHGGAEGSFCIATADLPRRVYKPRRFGARTLKNIVELMDGRHSKRFGALKKLKKGDDGDVTLRDCSYPLRSLKRLRESRGQTIKFAPGLEPGDTLGEPVSRGPRGRLGRVKLVRHPEPVSPSSRPRQWPV